MVCKNPHIFHNQWRLRKNIVINALQHTLVRAERIKTYKISVIDIAATKLLDIQNPARQLKFSANSN